MIEKLLKPKKDEEILHDINMLRSPVLRFVNLFAFHYNQSPNQAVKELLLSLNKNEMVNVHVSISTPVTYEHKHKTILRALSIFDPDPVYEIIVSTRHEPYREKSFDTHEQKMITIRNKQVFIA